MLILATKDSFIIIIYPDERLTDFCLSPHKYLPLFLEIMMPLSYSCQTCEKYSYLS